MKSGPPAWLHSLWAVRMPSGTLMSTLMRVVQAAEGHEHNQISAMQLQCLKCQFSHKGKMARLRSASQSS